MGWRLFVVIALGVAAVWNYKQVKKERKKIRAACFSVLNVAYFLSVAVVTFGTRLPDVHMSVQLEPLLSYKRAIIYGSEMEALEILYNVLLFVPFGVLLPAQMENRKSGSILQVVKYAFYFTLGIEFLQLITRLGCFEIDDMINNVLGAAIGYLIFRIIRRIKI